MSGLDLSLRRLLLMRSRANGTVCLCDENGNIITVKAKEVKQMMTEN